MINSVLSGCNDGGLEVASGRLSLRSFSRRTCRSSEISPLVDWNAKVDLVQHLRPVFRTDFHGRQLDGELRALGLDRGRG
ncbi:unnamed protein product [Ectocarpus sp. 4 AP-2014]